MLLIGAEGTDVARRVVYQTMSHHLILAFEAFPTETTRAPIDRTEMRPVLRVDIGMGTDGVDVRYGSFPPLSGITHLRRYCVWKGAAVQSGCVHL
jgi:hypothetical protein